MLHGFISILLLVALISPLRADQGVLIEAEDMFTITGTTVVREIPFSSGELCVDKARGQDLASHNGDVTLSSKFKCVRPGRYQVWMRAQVFNLCFGQITITVDKIKNSKIQGFTPLAWSWGASEPLDLAAGEHILEIVALDNNNKIDKLYIAEAGEAPSRVALDIMFSNDFETSDSISSFTQMSSGWKRVQDDQPEINYVARLNKSDTLNYALAPVPCFDINFNLDYQITESAPDGFAAIIFDFENDRRFSMLRLSPSDVSLWINGKRIRSADIKPPMERKYVHVAMIRSGSLLRLLLDNRLVLEERMLNLAGGRLGFGGTHACVLFDNIAIGHADDYYFSPSNIRMTDPRQKAEDGNASVPDSDGDTGIFRTWGRDSWTDYRLTLRFGLTAGRQGIVFHKTPESHRLCTWNGDSLEVSRIRSNHHPEIILTSKPTLLTSNTLELISVHGRTRIRINNELVADFNSGTDSGGQAGIYVSRDFKGWFSGFEIKAFHQFNDFFSGGTQNRLTQWIPLHGDWRIIGTSEFSHSGIEDSLTASSAGQTAVIITRNRFQPGFIASLRVIPSAEGMMGLGFNYQTQNKCEVLRMTPTETEGIYELNLVRMTDSEETVLARTTAEFLREEWNDLSLAVYDNGEVFVSVNRKKAIETRSLIPPSTGRIALFSDNACDGYFDDVIVESL